MSKAIHGQRWHILVCFAERDISLVERLEMLGDLLGVLGPNVEGPRTIKGFCLRSSDDSVVARKNSLGNTLGQFGVISG